MSDAVTEPILPDPIVFTIENANRRNGCELSAGNGLELGTEALSLQFDRTDSERH